MPVAILAGRRRPKSLYFRRREEIHELADAMGWRAGPGPRGRDAFALLCAFTPGLGGLAKVHPQPGSFAARGLSAGRTRWKSSGDCNQPAPQYVGARRPRLMPG